MALPCTRENTTKCEPCVPGETYSPVESHSQGCKLCSMCPENSHVAHRCNVTHNTVCLCDSGFYFLNGICIPCSLCKPGDGVARPCGKRGNTVCRPCKAGISFSDSRSGTDRCRPCQVCGPNQIEKHPCLISGDTICVGESFLFLLLFFGFFCGPGRVWLWVHGWLFVLCIFGVPVRDFSLLNSRSVSGLYSDRNTLIFDSACFFLTTTTYKVWRTLILKLKLRMHPHNM